MKTTRQRLIEYLHEHPGVPVSDLSRALTVTEADIRHHLACLVKEGLAEVVGSVPNLGRGRPPNIYKLTQKASLDNYQRLADACLNVISNLPPLSETDQFFELLAKQMAGTDQVPQSLSLKLLHAIYVLNQHHYDAHWEARAKAPQLVFSHCPYAELLPDHPELCRFDAILLSQLLGVPVCQTTKIDREAHEKTFCIFKVSKSSI